VRFSAAVHYNRMNIRTLAVSLSTVAALAACGGGSGSNGAMYVPPVLSVTPKAQQSAITTATFATATRGTQTGWAADGGFAVYHFDLDLTSPGTSACTGTCATFWPPLAPQAGVALVAPFGTITRPDGSKQLAYNGHPLYLYAQDTNTSTASGDGLNISGGLWHLASAASLTTPL
jgi:predicted lipoprotein with Yx(FWY)xxD motif